MYIYKNIVMVMKKYKLCCSREGYKSKPRVEKIIWEPTTLSAFDIGERIKNGYSFCGNFGFDKAFIRGRTKANFISTPFLFFDMDDISATWDEIVYKFVNHQSDEYKPTFVYTTFSHQLEGKGNRYRLVYLFDEEIGANEYEIIYSHYLKHVVDVLGEEIDTCSKTYTQPMHSTHYTLPSFHYVCTDNVIQKRFVVDVVSGVNNAHCQNCNCFTNINTHNTTLTDTGNCKNGSKFIYDSFSKEERILLVNQSFTDYLAKNSERFFIYRDNWNELGERAKRSRVISIEPSKRWDKESKTYQPYLLQDGQGRKKRLYIVGLKIRLINPNVTKEELLYNIVYWMYNYTIQGNDPIKWKDILEITNNALNKDLDEYQRNRLAYMYEKGIADEFVDSPYIEKKKRKYKKVEDVDIADMPFNASIEETAKALNVSTRTIYNHTQKKRAESKKNKKDKFIELINKGMKREDIMKDLGISERTYYRYLKDNKISIDNKTTCNVNVQQQTINVIIINGVEYGLDEAKILLDGLTNASKSA